MSADDMNLLRNLARACTSLLKELVRKRVKTRGMEELQVLDLANGEAKSMGERSCWIIVSIIVGVWAQRDLWMDAEDSLCELAR